MIGRRNFIPSLLLLRARAGRPRLSLEVFPSRKQFISDDQEDRVERPAVSGNIANLIDKFKNERDEKNKQLKDDIWHGGSLKPGKMGRLWWNNENEDESEDENEENEEKETKDMTNMEKVL